MIRKAILFTAFLSSCSCYHMRDARFVDGSDGKRTLWVCGEDDDPTNPAGVACLDMANVAQNHPEILLDFLNAMPTPDVPVPDAGVVHHSTTEM